jgi:hypothetical protein
MLITKSLAVCLRDQPDDTTLDAAVAAWAEILADVPADQLQACYRAAWSLPEHKPGFPVTADEVLAAWYARRPTAPPLPRLDKAYWQAQKGR